MVKTSVAAAAIAAAVVAAAAPGAQAFSSSAFAPRAGALRRAAPAPSSSAMQMRLEADDFVPSEVGGAVPRAEGGTARRGVARRVFPSLCAAFC